MPPEGGRHSQQSSDRGADGLAPMKAKEAELDTESVRVDGRLYDAAKLASVHPGGEMFVRAFAGSDASSAFLSYHRRRFPHAKMTEYRLATSSMHAKDADADNADYLELCSLVEQMLPGNKAFAPWHYFAKVAFLVTSAVCLEVYMHWYVDYRWQFTASLGWLMALIGLNVQHDANHGATHRNPVVNRALGLTQNWIGGSAIDWVHQHVVQHHVHCNDVNTDPDMAGSWFLRLNPRLPVLKHQVLQGFYVFVLLAGFGFNVVVMSMVHLMRGKHVKDMAKLIDSYRHVEMGTWFGFMLRWVVLPVYRTGSFAVFKSTCWMYIVAGYYLSFFFIISHNFEGAQVFDETKVKKSTDGNIKSVTSKIKEQKGMSFLYRQVTSSSNVCGAGLCLLNGGLNYQIEHHLFPRISHCHYPKLAPLVRAFCNQKGIPYQHFPTLGSNVASMVRHLSTLGNADDH